MVLTAGTGKLALNSDIPLPKPTKDNELLDSMLVFSVVSGGATTSIVALTAGAVVLIKLTGPRCEGKGLVTAASVVNDIEDIINSPKTATHDHQRMSRPIGAAKWQVPPAAARMSPACLEPLSCGSPAESQYPQPAQSELSG